MTNLRKAAEMALQALEEMSIVIDGELWARQINAKTKEALRQALSNEFNPNWNQVEALQESLREHMAEIQRLRQALAQLEQEPIKYKCTIIDDEYPNGIPLEQWGNTSPPHYWGNVTNAELVEELRRRGMMESLYPEQEPVAWLNVTDEGERYIQFAGSVKDFNEGTKFYTTPPRREWVGLTSDDKHFLLANAWNKEQAFDGFMDAIDKFLKEKNT